jgi:predicted HTH transcriptional regulator
MIDGDFFLQQIRLGEDSRWQFKATLHSPEQTAAEIVAFLNSGGGRIFVGVRDDGTITGLEPQEIRRINQLISNTAAEKVRPAASVKTFTESVRAPSPIEGAGKNDNDRERLPLTEAVNERIILVIEVPDGIHKPYCDNDGRFWVKQGADKRKVVAPEELQRLFQLGRRLFADETILPETSSDDIDLSAFGVFYERKFAIPFAAAALPFGKILNALGLAKDGRLTLAAMLLFGRNAAKACPLFKIQAVAVSGSAVADDTFLDKCDCEGRLAEQFAQALNFAQRNLRKIPDGASGFNQPGEPELKMEAVSELLVNALIHRDYFVNASVKLLIFDDRLEIQSPGVLPNSLTVENIRQGISVPRNSILLSHAQYVLPYSGLGSGIPRALKYCPELALNNDVEAGRFVAALPRKKI